MLNIKPSAEPDGDDIFEWFPKPSNGLSKNDNVTVEATFGNYPDTTLDDYEDLSLGVCYEDGATDMEDTLADPGGQLINIHTAGDPRLTDFFTNAVQFRTEITRGGVTGFKINKVMMTYNPGFTVTKDYDIVADFGDPHKGHCKIKCA